MGSKAPEAPDYKGAAEAQGASSRENIEYQTYANRPEMQTPWGSSTWENRAPPGSDTPDWINRVTLGGAQQGALDDQMAVQEGISGFAKDRLDQLGTTAPMDYNNLPGMAGTPDVPDFYGEKLPGMGQMPEGTLPVGGPRPGEGGPGDPFTDIQNYGSLGGMMGPAGGGGGQPGIGGFMQGQNQQGGARQQGGPGSGPGTGGMMSNVRDRAEGALYDRTASRLDPRMQQQQESLESSLFNKGLRPGDQAYDREMEKFEQGRTDAYQQANMGAIIGGGQEASRTFGMGLQSGQFQNQLQQQQFNQAAQLRGEEGAAASGQFDQQMRLAGMQDQQRQQLMQEQLAYGQQGFGQQMQQAQFQNQLRQQAIAEQMQQRGMGINEINAMLHGQQVQMPGMPNFQAAGAADATNYLGAAGMEGEYGIGKYGADQAMMQGLMGGATSLAAMSDIRLKEDIRETGVMGQLKTYSWRWNKIAEELFGLTGKGVGFLANEVAELFPQHVNRMGGTNYVGIDYEGVYKDLEVA